MRIRRVWGCAIYIVLAIGVAITSHASVFAITSSSTNYQITETQFSAASTDQSCSDQYCAQATIGNATGGTTPVTNSASFGQVNDNQPILEMIVVPGESNLGVLNTEHTATKTTVVQIRNFLTGGYTLQMIGDVPKYDGHSLSALTSPTASVKGTEQFGINVVANTTPVVGTDPLQTPSGSTAFGIVNDDYKTPNQFKYVSGDTIAHSTIDSGQTNYTISMIINISNSTPAGHYSGDFAAVVIPAF